MGESRRSYNLISREISRPPSPNHQTIDPGKEVLGSYECRHCRHTYDHHISEATEIFSAIFILSISLSPPQSSLCVNGRLRRALTIFGIAAGACAEERDHPW